MIRRILVISTVPEARLAALARELRLRYSGAQITALVGVTPMTAASREAAECLAWGSYRLRGLIGELRSRRFDLVVVAHGREQYLSRGYWGAAALAAIGVGCSRTRFCEDGRLARSAIPAVAVSRAAAQLAEECYVLAMGVLLFLPVLMGVALSDLSEALVGRRPAGRRGKGPGER